MATLLSGLASALLTALTLLAALALLAALTLLPAVLSALLALLLAHR
ncbi:MAG: hypothetical protein JO341_04950, partial [Gammaproteobacteria bacterium]|nr:hypothetical protein [Gammaproteobacteria bacterium]